MLTERQSAALEMWRSGKTNREIGVALDVTPGRARILVSRATLLDSQTAWARGLPSQYVKVLMSHGINTVSSLRSAIADGSIHRIPRVGPKCYAAITKWVDQQ